MYTCERLQAPKTSFVNKYIVHGSKIGLFRYNLLTLEHIVIDEYDVSVRSWRTETSYSWMTICSKVVNYTEISFVNIWQHIYLLQETNPITLQPTLSCYLHLVVLFL